MYAIQERVAELISTIPLFHHKAVQFYNHETFSNWPVIQGSDLVNQISITEIVQLTDNKVVNIGSDEPTDGFSPFDASAQISIDLMFLYGRILQYKPEGGLQGDQAESWKAVDDTTIEVTLRNGLTFHDGVPLTADDVAFTFNYIKDWEIPVYAGLIEAIESVEAVDADTVVKEKNLVQMSDEGDLLRIVQEIVAANPDQVKQFKEGKTKVMGFFVGQLMQKTKGRANPKMANKLFADELNK